MSRRKSFAWIARALFGTNPFGLRLLPAVAGSAIVALTWSLTTLLLGTHSFLSMNVLDHLFWIAM